MIRRFYDWVTLTWTDSHNDEKRAASIAALGLAGESGEVIEYFKKWIRSEDERMHSDSTFKCALELGDVIHYWCRLVKSAGYTPEEVLQMHRAKLDYRRANGKAPEAEEVAAWLTLVAMRVKAEKWSSSREFLEGLLGARVPSTTFDYLMDVDDHVLIAHATLDTGERISGLPA